MTSSLRRCVRPALAGALLLAMASAGAQVYKWVDKKGVVHYSDTPPANAPARQINASGSAEPAVALPYELARAVRDQPVTFYSTTDCDACDQGRALLRARGIPFAEKTVSTNDDKRQLEQAGSEGKLPLLLVGRAKLTGFETGAWNDALTSAAYPAQSRLPAAWRNPPAQSAAAPRPPAAPARTAAEEAAARAAAAPAVPPPPRPDTPPGFRF